MPSLQALGRIGNSHGELRVLFLRELRIRRELYRTELNDVLTF